MTQTTHRPQTRAQRGLTILEMLVVVTILAATAAIGFTNFTGVIEDSKEKIARTEMQEIARAIRQFRQDTGYYPKQGPFRLVADGGTIDPGNLPEAVGTNTDERRTWLNSPANFWQLYVNPLAGTSHLLASWNPDTGRGWRGPYLQRAGEGYVDLSSNLGADGNGDPAATNGSLLASVPGVADPFERDPIEVGTSIDADGALLDWWSVARADPNTPPDTKFYLGGIGGPYFVLDLSGSSARIVSMGPNGVYGGIATDSSGSTICAPGDNDATTYRKADDIVLCLH